MGQWKNSQTLAPLNYTGAPRADLQGTRANYKGPNKNYAFGAPNQQQLIDLIGHLRLKLGNSEYGSEEDKQAQLAKLQRELAGFGPSALEMQRQQNLQGQARSNELMRILKGDTAPYNSEAEQARLQQGEQQRLQTAEQQRQQQAAAIAKKQEEARLNGAAAGLTTKELLPKAYEFINNQKSAMANLPKATYQSKQVASKSPLTERSEELRNYYANKGSPYGNKINTLLNQESQGFSPTNMNTIKDFSRNKQEAFGNKSLDILRNQFRDPNAVNSNRYQKKHTKDIATNQNEFGEHLGVFGRQLRNTENMSIMDKFRVTENSGSR